MRHKKALNYRYKKEASASFFMIYIYIETIYRKKQHELHNSVTLYRNNQTLHNNKNNKHLRKDCVVWLFIHPVNN